MTIDLANGQTTTRRRRPTGLAVVGALALAPAALWVLWPHVSSDQDPDVVGQVPQGVIVTVPRGEDVDLAAKPSTSTTILRVTNDGLLPVTVSAPRPAELTGPGSTASMQIGLSRTGSAPYAAQLTLGRGEQVAVVITLEGTACSSDGGAQSLTTLEDVILRAAVGPVTSDVRVSAWATHEVVTKDGSALPACP